MKLSSETLRLQYPSLIEMKKPFICADSAAPVTSLSQCAAA